MVLFTAICTAQSKYKTPADDIEACFCYISCSNNCISYPSMSSSNKSAEFPDIQKAFLKSFLPENEKYIAEHNPGHKSHSKDLKDWRVENARLLMQGFLCKILASKILSRTAQLNQGSGRRFILFFSFLFSMQL